MKPLGIDFATVEITGLTHSNLRYALARALAYQARDSESADRCSHHRQYHHLRTTEARDLTSPSCIRNVEMCQASCSNAIRRALSNGAQAQQGPLDGPGLKATLED
jgi:hypothetical protein